MKILSIHFKSIIFKGSKQTLCSWTVGKNCKEIIEHSSRGEGDKWFYDVEKNDGAFERIFNPEKISYEGSEGEKIVCETLDGEETDFDFEDYIMRVFAIEESPIFDTWIERLDVSEVIEYAQKYINKIVKQ